MKDDYNEADVLIHLKSGEIKLLFLMSKLLKIILNSEEIKLNI